MNREWWNETFRKRGIYTVKRKGGQTLGEFWLGTANMMNFLGPFFDELIGDVRPAVVLDYGCGWGRWIHFFLARGLDYVGVDISSDMIEVARRDWKCAPQVQLFTTEEFKLSELDEYGDRSRIAVTVHVLQHIVEESVRASALQLLADTQPTFLFSFETTHREDDSETDRPVSIQSYRDSMPGLDFRVARTTQRRGAGGLRHSVICGKRRAV